MITLARWMFYWLFCGYAPPEEHRHAWGRWVIMHHGIWEAQQRECSTCGKIEEDEI